MLIAEIMASGIDQQDPGGSSDMADALDRQKKGKFVPINSPGADGSQSAIPSPSKPFDTPIAMGLTPPSTNPTGQPIGSPSNPSGDPAKWSKDAIAAQQPLIDAQVKGEEANTALKGAALAKSQDDLARSQYDMKMRMSHHGRSRTIGQGSSLDMNGNVKPAGSDPLSERRINPDGSLNVSTPNLDAAGLPKPVSSVDRNGNAVATPTNPNAAIAAHAQMNRATGGNGSTPGRVIGRDAPGEPLQDNSGVTFSQGNYGAGHGDTPGIDNEDATETYRKVVINKGGYGRGGYGTFPNPTAAGAIRPPLRPRRVSQSAIVNPRVNPLFQTSVA
jgi:hypothetical protein